MNAIALEDERLIRIKEVMFLTGLARSTLYKWVQEKRFPAPIKLSKQFAAWRRSEVRNWIAGAGEGGAQGCGVCAAEPAAVSQ